MEEFRILGEERKDEQEDMTYEEYLQRKDELKTALYAAIDGMTDPQGKVMLRRMMDTLFKILEEEADVINKLNESELPEYDGDNEDVLKFLLATSLIESSLLAICRGPMQDICDLVDKGCGAKLMSAYLPLMMLVADSRTTLEKAALTVQEMSAQLVQEVKEKERKEKDGNDDEREESRGE